MNSNLIQISSYHAFSNAVFTWNFDLNQASNLSHNIVKTKIIIPWLWVVSLLKHKLKPEVQIPVRVTLFGNMVFADAIELGWGYTGFERVLNPKTSVLIRRSGEDTMWRRTEQCNYELRNTKDGAQPPEAARGAWTDYPPRHSLKGELNPC